MYNLQLSSLPSHSLICGGMQSSYSRTCSPSRFPVIFELIWTNLYFSFTCAHNYLSMYITRAHTHTHTHTHTVALQVASKKQVVFGAELTVEVGYSLPKPQEECALIVKGLPLIPALNPALEYYFKQQGHEVIFCEIVDQVAYLKFNDPTGERVVSVQCSF